MGSEMCIRDRLIIVVRDDIKPDAQKFVDYVLSPEGQNFVEASGYIKLTRD